MKPESMKPRRAGVGNRGSSRVRIPYIPMEWMDPISWRLPSGKALAEFALQTGFLAPLMLGMPVVKRKGTKRLPEEPAVIMTKSSGEAQEGGNPFRETR